jgi:hypothetical protein
VRQALVIGQFAVLVALVVVAITIARQTLYALNEGMRVDNGQVLLLFAQPCLERMRDEVRKLPGVQSPPARRTRPVVAWRRRDRRAAARSVDITPPVDFGFFDVFGIRPLAGRVFDRAAPPTALSTTPTHSRL